jgi:transcriptional regulator
LIVFQGAHGYVSPSWLRDRTQAPTWNFSTVHYLADIVFDPGLDAAVAAVDQLSAAMEGADPNAWSPGEMGARHAALARGVIAFRARVVQTNAKFKLGQNERDDVLDDILDGLQRSAQAELRRDMVMANRKRRTND